MINLTFSFLLPIPLLGGGAGGLTSTVKGAAIKFSHLVYFFEIFLMLVFLFFLIFVGFRIYQGYIRRKLRNLLIFLYRLHSELLLHKYSQNEDKAKRLEIGLSKEESVAFIQNVIKQKFFVRRVSKHEAQRITDGLNLIKDNKVDIDVQLLLLNNWIELVKFL